MVPGGGATDAERWVARGRSAAAEDLVRLLLAAEAIDPVYVLAAEAHDRQGLAALGVRPWDRPEGAFHFGHALGQFVDDTRVDRLAYFGAASAPLLSPTHLLEAADRLASGHGPTAVVNNYHSTDWALFTHADHAVRLAPALPNDNPLGWVLAQDGGYTVAALPPSAATRADLDTPADFVLLRHHPELGGAMARFLEQAPPVMTESVSAIRQVLRTPASNLTIIGRCSSHLWQLLERRGQTWVRLLVEERGMVASGRLERGEVRSMVGEMLDSWGPVDFVRRLSGMTDAVLWDTRVWMAHHGGWPSVADRFAADLGWADGVEQPELRALTAAIGQARIPILTGGHGVVSGSVYALVETLDLP
jgi:CTP:molybdopterin cytidylyltransferase MocA